LEHARLAEFVLRQRRAAPRAPLRRAVAADEPSAIVHDLEEPPDVFDVGVAERVVVALPVHPLPEPLGRPPQLRRGPGDEAAALSRSARAAGRTRARAARTRGSPARGRADRAPRGVS